MKPGNKIMNIFALFFAIVFFSSYNNILYAVQTNSIPLSSNDTFGVNVKKFGASGDGITDDTISIQNALNSGRKVYLPPGKYRITKELVVPSGAGLIGEKAPFYQELAQEPKNPSDASQIYYDGQAGTNTCVVRVSPEPVGIRPRYPKNIVDVVIDRVFINGNSKADIGLYIARASISCQYSNLVITKTLKHGLWAGEIWTTKFTNLLAIYNYGCGFSFGRNSFGWDENVVNANHFDTIQAYKNGLYQSFNESSNIEEGYGIGFYFYRSNIATNIICELNDGVGLFLSPGSGPNKIIGLYLEDNNHFKADSKNTAVSQGRASEGWGLYFKNRTKNNKGISVNMSIDTVYGAFRSDTFKQSIRITSDQINNRYIELEEPLVLENMFGGMNIKSDMRNYVIRNSQKKIFKNIVGYQPQLN